MVIHGDKLRWLFWLRWKMFLRGFTRASGRVSYIIGTIFQFLFGLLIGGAVGVISFFAYRYLDAPANAEVLVLVLTGAYLLWLILPLFEFSVNEGLDISKLSLFPLTRWELMTSLLFSTLLDIPTIGLFLVLAAVVVGWAFSVPLALIALLTMLVFYAQVVGMSQLVLALLARTLQSRRFRDLTVILFVIFSSSCYLIQQFVFRGLASSNFLGALKNATFSPYLQWLPPGMAARAVQQASLGNWGASLAWLAGLVVATLVVLYLWQLVVERGLSSTEGGASTVRVRRQQERPVELSTGEGTVSIWRRLLPPQVLAIAVKDLKYYRRDPQLLGQLFQSVFSIVVLLVVLCIGVVEVALIILLAAFLTGAWSYVLPAFAIGLAGIGVILGIGNFTSVFFPMQMRQIRRGFQSPGVNASTQSGCLRGIMSLATLACMLVVMIPVGLALVLPVFLNARWVWFASIPASLVYGAAIYFVVTALVAPRIVERTPEILAATTRE